MTVRISNLVSMHLNGLASSRQGAMLNDRDLSTRLQQLLRSERNIDPSWSHQHGGKMDYWGGSGR
jgi:hypothetical protein